MVNVVGTTQLLDAFTRAGHVPGHVVLTSSRAVYGEGAWRRRRRHAFQPGPRTHAQLDAAQWDPRQRASALRRGVHAARPVNVYGATKLAQEHVLPPGPDRSVPLSVLRLQNVYGPGSR